MYSSSENDSDIPWKRQRKEREDENEFSFWENPPKRIKENLKNGKKKSRKCRSKNCDLDIRNMPRHIKFHHMPAATENTSGENRVHIWSQVLWFLVSLLNLNSVGDLMHLVKGATATPIRLSDSDKILINDMAEYFEEEGENGEFLSAYMKLCYLVHWAVFVNIMNLLNCSQLLIFKKEISFWLRLESNL